MGRSTTARDETASTTRIRSPAASRSARRSLTTPVEVSQWVAKTTPIPGSAARAAATASGSTGRPHSPATWWTPIPPSAAISAQRSPKLPQEATRTRSPGRARLTAEEAIAAVPDPVSTSTSAAVCVTRPRAASVSAQSAVNSSLRW